MAKQNIHPESRSNYPGEEKRKISGELHVRGEIEASIPSSAIEQYKAARQENTTRDNWRFAVECITLGFVVLVTILSVWQAKQATRSANAADATIQQSEKNFRIDAAPYVDFLPINPQLFQRWERTARS